MARAQSANQTPLNKSCLFGGQRFSSFPNENSGTWWPLSVFASCLTRKTQQGDPTPSREVGSWQEEGTGDNGSGSDFKLLADLGEFHLKAGSQESRFLTQKCVPHSASAGSSKLPCFCELRKGPCEVLIYSAYSSLRPGSFSFLVSLGPHWALVRIQQYRIRGEASSFINWKLGCWAGEIVKVGKVLTL